MLPKERAVSERMRSMLGFTHYTSDPHYGHANILAYAFRPFSSVDEQIATLIERYNECVGRDDHVLFLGDLFLSSQYEHVIRSLSGRKTLVAGNHDDGVTTRRLLRYGFERVERGSTDDEIAGHRVRYSHFPPAGGSLDERYPERRPAREEGVTIIHGHTHQRERRTTYGTVHVGVDAWDYRPASCAEVAALLLEPSEEGADK
jgi:calcineurin-like phosphoesterase family protein